MYTHIHKILTEADAVAPTDERAMYAILRQLPIEEFVHCIFYAPEHFKNLHRRLPRLPSPEIQRNYVGNDGTTLEHMTAAFVRNLRTFVSRRFPNGFPRDGKVLDYGCGWGRILRMMPFLTEPDCLFGTDPMQQSLNLCKELDVTGSFALCGSIPHSVAFSPVQFDLVYAFSVFTHLSEESASAVLRSVRQRTTDRGMFLVTVRPIEFWDVVAKRYGDEEIARLKQAHREDRYAFVPSDQLKHEDRPTYGDTSISLPLLKQLAREAGWSLDSNYERSLVDPFQLVCALHPL